MVRWQSVAALFSVLLIGSTAHATNISYTGTFAHDTDLAYFTFTLANPTPGVALRTWSYAGGTNAAGQTIARGGFEPYLNIYMADGMQMNPGFSGPCTAPPTGNRVADLVADPTTGACADVLYPTTRSFPAGIWAPGTYIVVLSTFANPGIGNLSDGFFADVVLGLPAHSNFTCQPGPFGYQGTPTTVPVDQPFCDEWAPNTARDGHWALDILNVDGATGPAAAAEPGTAALILAGFVLLTGSRRRYGNSLTPTR